MTVERDILLLLEPGFCDPGYGAARALPDAQTYYCPYCAALEGVLATYPRLAGAISVERVPYPRPRQAVAARLGDANQGLPKLILADDAPDTLATGQHGSVRFVDGHEAIMRALSVRHGVPYPHF